MSERKVHKFCYPGKTANAIASDIQTTNIRDSPSYVIVHAGTNNLPEQPSSTCLGHIENLCLTVKSKFGNAKIGISGITLREDIHLIDNVQKVNNGIKEMCKKCKYTFIDDSKIKSNSLKSSKLNLNTKGSALLASGFINFLWGGRSFGSPRSNQFHAGSFRPEDFAPDAGHNQNGRAVSKPVEREKLVTFNVSNSIIELEEEDDSYCSIEPGRE